MNEQILSLPPEIFNLIVTYLNYEDVFRIHQWSSQFNKFSNTHVIHI